MIGKLWNDEVDVALAEFAVSAERMEVVDFLLTLQKSS
jgi:hypothetical protein